MDLLANVTLGLSAACTLQNLLYALLGGMIGTAIGILPRVGPVATMAMLLPATSALPALTTLILLASIYYGAQYGGATTAILVNMPGQSSSVATVIDGYQMALKGRAGQALTVAALGSFFAGCVGTLMVALAARPLAEFALNLGPAENFAVLLLGLTGAVVLASGTLLKAIGMVVMGLLLGTVGADSYTGVDRFELGVLEFSHGIGFVVIAMGVFGYGEIMHNLTKGTRKRQVYTDRVRGHWPTGQEVQDAVPAVVRGTLLGSLIGVLPGGGAVMAAFAAYTMEKRTPLKPHELPFGQGNIRGVAAPEAANNASAQTSFIPLLMLGMPPNAALALVFGAMALHGIQTGPQILSTHPALFWGLLSSMWIGNAMVAVLNLPLMGFWVQLLRAPYRWLFPTIVLFCAIGAYSTHHTTLGIWLVGLFGVAGYFFIKLGLDAVPFLLGFILAPAMENHLRLALWSSQGQWSVFLTQPVAAGLLGAAATLLVLVLLPRVKSKQ